MEEVDALDQVAGFWGFSSPMMKDVEMNQDRGNPNKYQKPNGKGNGRRERRSQADTHTAPRGAPASDSQVKQLAKILARHEAALQMLEADRSWVLFMDPGSMGIIPQLMETTKNWQRSRQLGSCNCGLRQALMGSLLMETVARLQKLGADQTAQKPLIQAKLLLTEPLRWPYMQWNAEKKSHEATGKTALQHDRVIAAAQMLTEHIVKDGVIHAFHARGGLSADREDTTIFKLTLSLDCPNKEKIREALHALADSASLRLIGARLRPERSHRPLPKDLAKMLADER